MGLLRAIPDLGAGSDGSELLSEVLLALQSPEPAMGRSWAGCWCYWSCYPKYPRTQAFEEESTGRAHEPSQHSPFLPWAPLGARTPPSP
ncbi:Hypothetical predicted protein [Podarcis lilfordi]|uniref:Uncharacterized protein n=1 Tax=Podarcis lilfordi TaxID=74358 RepID=A0AA35JY91_9SAUR|nr:Hypothetical predicted protein [Podarcis lilfordi]